MSRETDPAGDAAVVSVTQLNSGGNAYNVIPQSVTFGGTMRALTVESFNKLRARFEEVVTSTATAFRCRAELTFEKKPYPPTVNDKGAYQFAMDVAGRLYPSRVFEAPVPSMGGEDFAYYGQKIPACFMYIGIRNETAGSVNGLHHPKCAATLLCIYIYMNSP